MKSKHLILSFLWFAIALISFEATAQRPQQVSTQVLYSVLGKLLDDQGEPIPYASTVLYNTSDSSIVQGMATNANGYFELETKPGNYFLKISFLSFETKVIPNLVITKADINLKTITLTPSATALEAVNIEAERPQMELKLDKRVYNINQDLGNRGQNVTDILDNIPSVEVDVEGNVSLRNSQNVRILIDGKPSALVGVSSNDALRLIQSDQIERIEIITNPSARYDAEGEVGIINIILKKEKKKGLNGTFEARAGYPYNLGGSFTLNYRKNKLNLIVGYGLSYRERPGQGNTYHQFLQPDTTFSYTSKRDHSRNGLNNNLRLGFGYDFNKYNNISLSGNYNYGQGYNDAQVVYKDFDINEELSQTSNRIEDEYQDRTSYQGQFNYTRTFKRKGLKWTVDASIMSSESNEDADLNETSDIPSVEDLIQNATTTEKDARNLVQSDFVMPLGEEGKLEMGVKGNWRTIVNDYDVTEFDGTSWNDIFELNNTMEYTENVLAAYLMAGNKTKKFSYQAGLRIENSTIITDFKRTNEVNRRDYLSLFPSVNVSYEFKKNQFVQGSYSRRISRPRHWFLFPFYNLTDNRNISRGNPNLNPVFTDAFEIGYMKRWKNGSSILASPYYRYSTGTIERILLPDSNGINYRFPINLGTRNSFGLEVSGNTQIKKWWSLNGSLNLFREITEGKYENQDFNSDTYAWNARVVNKWKIKKKYSSQVSFNYRSKRQTTQGEQLPMYHFDIAAAMDVLKGNGTLTLSVRDVFNTRMRRNISSGNNFYDETDFQWMSRAGVLTFSYRLNQKKKPQRGSGDFDGGEM